MYADDSTGPKNTIHPAPVLVDDPPPVCKSIEAMSLDLSTDLWPWKQPWNWEDASMDWADQDMGQIILNQYGMIDAAQTDITMEAVPDLLDRTAAATDVNPDNHAQRQPTATTSTQSIPGSHGHGHGEGSGHVGGTSGTCSSGGNGDNDDPNIIITELAQLSVHLSPLRCSIYGLAGCVEAYHQNQDRQKSCIDDATFEAVAEWLSHSHGPANDATNIFSSPAQNPPFSPLPPPEGATASALLYNTFVASRHLLEILRYMQDNAGVSGTSTLSKSTLSNTTSLTSASSSGGLYFGLSKSSSSSSSSLSTPRTPGDSPSKYCNNIIRHLVIACHTILLDIYVAVLAILERDTDPTAHRDNTAALGDIR